MCIIYNWSNLFWFGSNNTMYFDHLFLSRLFFECSVSSWSWSIGSLTGYHSHQRSWHHIAASLGGFYITAHLEAFCLVLWQWKCQGQYTAQDPRVWYLASYQPNGSDRGLMLSCVHCYTDTSCAIVTIGFTIPQGWLYIKTMGLGVIVS